MKRIATLMTLLALVLALAVPAACAEASEAVKGVFDALVAEDSGYSQNKAAFAGYFPDATFEEALDGDGFTITVSGTEYSDGSWTYTRDGDYLTATFTDGDFSGLSTALFVMQAAGSYYGLNPSLVTSYANGVSSHGLQSDDFAYIRDEAAGTSTVRVYIAGPWAMKELDELAFEEVNLPYDALGESSTSMGGSCGKVMMVANGSAADVTILLGEYGGLDALAYTSLINIVKVLQPNGWEDFTAAYTELADVEAAGYSVKLNADAAAVGEIIEDANSDYSFAIVHFGA